MLIIGHRGCNLEPENTLRSLAKGIECADFVEVDVRMSKDGVPMIMHDRTLERTTNGKGMVKDFTLEQLKELDAGKGEKIPTLQEVFDLVRDRGLLVEIKEAGSEGIIRGTIKERRFTNIMLVSFNPGSLRNAKEMLPDIKTGIIYSRTIENPVRLALKIKANVLLPKYELASGELIERAHKHNLMVFPWTLNTEQEIRRAVDIGVDGFATDDPCLARQLLRIFL
jgi:glycerophosphoryl diester phosphodiesterase